MIVEKQFPAWYPQERVDAIKARRSECRVYFARAVDLVGPVKIGCSHKPLDRIGVLSNWCPYRLTVLASMHGSYALETRFHTLFAANLSHNEWFHWTPEMQAVIDAVASGMFDIDTLPAGAKRSYGGRHRKKLIATQ